MQRIKTNIIIITVAVLGGFGAGLLALPFSVKYNILTKTIVEQKTVVVPQADYFGGAIESASPSVVAVQSFNQGRLLRSGSGIVLTQDGLIATLNILIPAQTETLQIIIDGKVYQGKVVNRDYAKNIALVSVPGSSLKASRFEFGLPRLAENLLVFSKTVELGKDLALVNDTIISQVGNEKSQFKIMTDYNLNMYGAAIVNHDGNILAMLDYNNLKPRVIYAKDINSVLDAYLKKIAK